MKLYLLLQRLDDGKRFFKYFETEFEMDRYKRKLRYSTNLMVVEDSRERILWD